MSSIKVINWLDNYRGFIGHLSDTEASNWKTVIKNNLDGVTQQEVDSAVAVLCERKQSNPTLRFTAKSIIDQIKDSRYVRQNGYTPSMAYCTVKEGDGWVRVEVAELKKRLNVEASPERAWNIICSPLENEACRILHAYADNHNILYARFTPPKDESLQGLTRRALR